MMMMLMSTYCINTALDHIHAWDEIVLLPMNMSTIIYFDLYPLTAAVAYEIFSVIVLIMVS